MFPASESDYRNWRATRLDRYPGHVQELVVDIAGLATMDSSEKAAIGERIQRANMAIYSCRDGVADRAAIRSFAAQFGLTRPDHHLCANDDGVSELTVTSGGMRGGYVPYSNRSLSWHTDGYYNKASSRVRAVVLHCVQPAETGGDNAMLDPEIAYIRLRDENPAFIDAFEHTECMTIPANPGDRGEIRSSVSGPVFFRDGQGGALQMRFSARKKHIRWRDDPATTAAREFLAELLADETGLVLHYRLQAGQGLISNNILHNRTAFVDAAAQTRFLYRARFFDRVESS